MNNQHFWKEEESPHNQVFSTIARLKGTVDDRDTKWRRYLSIFLNKDVSGFGPTDVPTELDRAKNYLTGEKRLIMNPIENCITTLAARIASQKPRAQFLTSTDSPDGWDLKQKALGLEKFIAGEWSRSRFYQKSIKVFYHAGIMGLGAMHIYPGDDHVNFEVCPPWELVVDEQSALCGETRELYRVKYVPAEMLIARFAHKELKASERKANEAAIKRCVTSGGSISGSYKITSDLVKVIEAWHLPSGYGAEDGRHVICVEGRTLLPKEEWSWTYDKFPFAFYRWNEPVFGWYPQSLVEQQEPIQQQENKLLARVQDAMHLYSVANTFYEEGSISKKDFKNTSGNLIPIKKTAQRMPVTQMPPSVSAEVFRFIGELHSRIFEGTGVSRLSAASVKPAGIESGRGLMVLKDSESGRHALTNQQWDTFHTDAAELTVIAAKEIFANNEDFETSYKTRDRVERIKWANVDMDKDMYEIQVFPSSMLPHEPAGRLQAVENLIGAGFITRQQALVLLDMPDLEQFTSLENASYEDLEMQIGEVLSKGVPVQPQPYQDLTLGMAMFTSALLRAQQQGAPAERVELLMDWIEKADTMLKQKMIEAAPSPTGGIPPEMPPGMPPGLPPGILPQGGQ